MRQPSDLLYLFFFYGGGWSERNFDQFKPHADYFAKRGLITVIVDYRSYRRDGNARTKSFGN
jgi:acetyl esterase/lipase